MSIITEIVTLRILDSIKSEDFIGIVDYLEKNYHSKQPGFIDTELLFNEKNGEWVMIQHWDNMKNLMDASKKIFTAPEASTFVKSIAPQSVKMVMLPQLRKW